jgi:hypothetical protein
MIWLALIPEKMKSLADLSRVGTIDFSASITTLATSDTFVRGQSTSAPEEKGIGTASFSSYPPINSYLF